ncbi:hypothetical protein ACHAW5_002523 [Stephanodiscus triporus]|uniref:Prokaryotic-type class I peptide chain release factors domain-containing protein n=1 Tax=Stephanodiscus triporus TaxID=2934178 RepID=A0ABD3Q9W8_9STRA
MPSLGKGDKLRLRVAGTSDSRRQVPRSSRVGRGGRSSNRVFGSMSGNGMTIDVVIDTLHLFSDLVALLPDKSLREGILNEVESVVERSRGRSASTSTGKSAGTTTPPPPPEPNEDDLEEKFVKGSGAGGKKVNKTSNRVILTHVPTQVRVECQDTRSLQMRVA